MNNLYNSDEYFETQPEVESLSQEMKHIRRKRGIFVGVLQEKSQHNKKLQILLISYAQQSWSELYIATFLQEIQNICSMRFSVDLFRFFQGPNIIKGQALLRNVYKGLDQDAFEKFVARHSFSSDIRLLGLQALLQSNSIMWSTHGLHGTIGNVEIYTTEESKQTLSTLLETRLWQSKKKIAPRIYEITIDNKKYILKERKIRMHLNAPRDGSLHETNDAHTELSVGATLRKDIQNISPDIVVDREKPIASVNIADNYEFGVYEQREAMYRPQNKPSIPLKEFFNFFIKNRHLYETEYKSIKATAQKIIVGDPILLRKKLSNTANYMQLGKYHLLRVFGHHELSYEDFAAAKSYWLRNMIDKVFERNRIMHGYTTDDGDEWCFTIKNISNKLAYISVMGYDYERFWKQTKKSQSNSINWFNNKIKEQHQKAHPVYLIALGNETEAGFYVAYHIMLTEHLPKLLILSKDE